MECADDVSCLCEQGAQIPVHTFDRQVRQPIVALGLKDMIGQTLYGPVPSTDYNIYMHLNHLT